MALLISNSDIESLIDMGDCISALENMYKESAQNRAKELPRPDMHFTYGQDMIYNFASMAGIYPAEDVVAIRIKSDMVSWRERREKLALAPGNRWVGLVLLFSISTLRLLAIMPDGIIQKFRVGATTVLGAKYLARNDAITYGLVGSGWQASAQIDGMTRVRSLKKIKIYSPNPDRRKHFAQEWERTLGIDVVPVEKVEDVCAESDIVGCATNSLVPVIYGNMLGAGTHVTCIRPCELDDSVIQKADLCFVHSFYTKGSIRTPKQVLGSSERLSDTFKEDLHEYGTGSIDWSKMHELKDLIGGAVASRTDNQQITCFVNNFGIGLQFAAVCSFIYKKAKVKGAGNELPDDWFSQDVRD